jgi:thiol-disulfide isomerase/thioredoxin
MQRGFFVSVMLAWLLVYTGHAQMSPAASYGFDLQGKPVVELAAPGTRAVVLLFIATDCPISNRYAPEIERLKEKYAGSLVTFWLVYPNATETSRGVVRHQAAYSLEGATLVRPSARFIAEAGVTITPEAAVLVPAGSGWRTIYSGRIDDRYVDIGRERPKATRHDLEAAIDAALAHRPVVAAGGPPVGCGIVSQAALETP